MLIKILSSDIYALFKIMFIKIDMCAKKYVFINLKATNVQKNQFKLNYLYYKVMFNKLLKAELFLSKKIKSDQKNKREKKKSFSLTLKINTIY